MKVNEAQFVLSAVASRDLLNDGLHQIAFVGRSNVGKSSLLNRLVGRKALARISSSPGKTRAVNYFAIDTDCYFVDLPGYGYAKAGKSERRSWATLMEGYFRVTRPTPSVLQLIDAKVGATPLDLQSVEYLCGQGSDLAVVATKIDRLSKNQRPKQLAEIRRALELGEATPIVACSARTGEGIKLLWREIGALLQSKVAGQIE